MVKKIIIGVSILLLSVVALGKTTWQFDGGLDGKSGLMIVYKTFPPLLVDVDEPEVMVVPKSKGSFVYSDVARSRKPLKGRIEINYDKSITDQGENGLNKKIIRTIYNKVKVSFLNNGQFLLMKDTNEIEPLRNGRRLDLENSIDGEVFFTNQNGLTRDDNKVQVLGLEDTVQHGILHTKDIYIDAKFNKDNKELMTGRYRGVATMVVEFLGNNAN